MNPVSNPFTPGAGRTPPYLAGREAVLEHFSIALQRIKQGHTNNPSMLYGLRGVGKTVLLNRIMENALALGFEVQFMEVDEVGEFDFKEAIFNCLKSILLKLDSLENLKSKFLNALRILKSISLNYSGVELSLNVDEALGEADSKNFQFDLTLLLQQLGNVAKDVKKPICIIIDELQNLSKLEMAALLSAMHRMVQLNLPIMIVGAGLPNLLGFATAAKSYTERFNFIEIGALKQDAAFDAFAKPFLESQVHVNNEAVQMVIAKTQGYPYFIQMFGEIAWNICTDNNLDIETIQKTIPEAVQVLDNSFFEARFSRTTDEERRFMYCMATTMNNGMADTTVIAQCLNKSAQHVGQYRNRLLEKGFIFSPKVGHLCFSVPLFEDFLIRKQQN